MFLEAENLYLKKNKELLERNAQLEAENQSLRNKKPANDYSNQYFQAINENQ